MSEVIFKRLRHPCPDELAEAVGCILDRAGLTAQAVGKTCLLKVNAMSREVLPGRNTSPWVLQAVLTQLRARFPKTRLIVADSDVAGYPQFAQACRNWGYDRIAAGLGAAVVNLADDDFVPVRVDDPICPVLEFPRTVLSADSIINLPVVKTHVLSGMTGCLKNHWGMLPRFRYQHHVRVSEVIGLINKAIGHTVLNIADGTVCIEGSGPKTGRPKICSVLFGGTDRVAVDAAVLDFMALPRDIAPHLAASERLGVGTADYRIVGDPFAPDPFDPPVVGKDIVSLLERKLRAIPGLGRVLYRPRIARVLGYIGTKYNEIVWFRLHGRALARAVAADPVYGPQFRELVK